MSALLREAVVEYLQKLDGFAWSNHIKDTG